VSLRDAHTVWPEAFWMEAMKGGVLPLLACGACGAVHYYPSLVCRACGSSELSHQQSAGKGKVYAATRSVQPDSPIISIIQLDEGPRVLAHLEGPILDIDTRVELVEINCDAAPKVIFRAAP
jgi:uncharacterized protein